MYDDEDDIAQREVIATEEQNYQELSQAEKLHGARIEALRDDEIEEDDSFEQQDRPQTLKKMKKRKHMKVKRGHHNAHLTKNHHHLK